MARQPSAEISERDRLTILLRYQRIKDGSANESVKDLCDEFQISRNVPANLFKKATVEGTMRSKSRSGRPNMVKDEVLQQRLVNAIRERRTIASRQLGIHLGCSKNTANRMRHLMGFRAQKRTSRPPLSQENMQKRLDWCQQHSRVEPHTAFLDEKRWHTFRSKKH